MRNAWEMGAPPTVRNYEDKLSEYKAIRAELATYITWVLTSPVRESGMTVHEVLSKAISSALRHWHLSQKTLAKCKVTNTYLSTSGLERLRILLRYSRLRDAYDASHRCVVVNKLNMPIRSPWTLFVHSRDRPPCIPYCWLRIGTNSLSSGSITPPMRHQHLGPPEDDCGIHQHAPRFCGRRSVIPRC